MFVYNRIISLLHVYYYFKNIYSISFFPLSDVKIKIQTWNPDEDVKRDLTRIQQADEGVLKINEKIKSTQLTERVYKHDSRTLLTECVFSLRL